MDVTAYDLFVRMNASSLVPIRVENLMTPEVAAVRERTTHGQFCWVCQPLLCQFILDNIDVEMVTYLEADSLFFTNPDVLFKEIEDKSVSLVPHNYSSPFDNTATAGKFCVQFNAFRNDAAAREVLAYWKACCFKYDKSAPSTYPGQTSLDDWPERFTCVAVIRNPGAGVAPWNVLGYALTQVDGVPHVDGVPIVFYHYHEYGRYPNGDHELGRYPYTKTVIDLLYRTYVREIRRAEAMVKTLDSSFNYRREFRTPPTLAIAIRSWSAQVWRDYRGVVKRKVRGRFQVYPDEYFPKDSHGTKE
jgi:hypothetical protein